MILVGGEPVVVDNVRGVRERSQNLVEKLLEHPVLVASANSLKEIGVKTMKPPHPSGNEEDIASADGDVAGYSSADPKYVYIFQKEYATVTPLFAELIGTDEITTCIGLVLRDPSSGLTSVGHFDSTDAVGTGVNQLLDSVVSISNSTIQVHIVGAYDDSSDYVGQELSTLSEDGLVKDRLIQQPGWSWPLALKMIDTLQNTAHNFEIETCCILQHNTSIGPTGYASPAIRGLVVETSSGLIRPARFEPEARGPDGTVRGVCMTTVASDVHRTPSLISPYETISDTFVISPFKWSGAFDRYAAYMLTLSDSELLEAFSTSPHAEGPDFLLTSRRIFTYMQTFPSWEQTFPNGLPRVFTRTSTGGWIQQEPSI